MTDLARFKLVCENISSDVENDAKNFDGQPFIGKTVAEYFGNHGAAIQALARINIVLIDELIRLRMNEE